MIKRVLLGLALLSLKLNLASFLISIVEAKTITVAPQEVLENVIHQNSWSREKRLKNILERPSQGREENKGVIDSILAFTKDPDPFIRAEAFKGLFSKNVYSSEKVVNAVNLGLQDNVWLVRRRCLNISILNNDRKAIEAALLDEDPQVRVMAVTSLRRYSKDPKAFSQLVVRLSDPYGQVVVETIGSLKLFGEKAIPYLRELFSHPDWKYGEVQGAVESISGIPFNLAIQKFGKTPLPIAIGEAKVRGRNYEGDIKCLMSNTCKDKVSAALVLAWGKTFEGLEALVVSLDHKNSRVRYAAARALQEDFLIKTREYPRIRQKINSYRKDKRPEVSEVFSVIREIQKKIGILKNKGQ